jgi:hypothetical protein
MSASPPKDTEGVPVEQESPGDPDAQNMDPHGLAYEFEVKGKNAYLYPRTGPTLTSRRTGQVVANSKWLVFTSDTIFLICAQKYPSAY